MLSKTIDSLVEDVYDLFDPSKDHVVNEENIHAFGENVKNLVRTRLMAQPEAKSPLRFSALGKPDRQIWYDAHSTDEVEEMSPKTYLKFMYGHLIEEMLLFLIKESGHKVEKEQHEIEVDGVLGHIDCIVDGVVADVKSAAPYSFQKFVNGSFYGDPFSKQYLDQLCGYSNVLTPEKSPAFIVFDKVSGELATVKVSASVAEDYKPEARISHLRSILASPEPPERCYPDEPDGKSGNRKLATFCGYCRHKRECWPGVRKFVYSNGPRYLTTVVKTPDVWEDKEFSDE